MGARDRAFCAETVYGCLRRRRVLEAIAASPETGGPDRAAARRLVAAYLLRDGAWSRAMLVAAGLPPQESAELARRAAELQLERLPLAVRAGLPDWLCDRLRERLPEAELLALGEAFDRPASVDLRVNVLRTSRDELRLLLAEEGFDCEPTPFSPVGLRRHARAPLFRTQAFRRGLFEVQDEGSQLVGLLVAPRPGEKVVDLCAGAGGKTLQLAALMRNRGSLYACDVAAARLERLRPRLRRAGIGNVRLVSGAPALERRLRRLEGLVDAVLVDAPCSGTGTLRRNPDIKWRPIDLAGRVEVQRKLLARAARLVRPGGRLVYATCSVLDEENAAVVEGFLAGNADFRAEPAEAILRRQGVGLGGDAFTPEGALQLYPHRHQTDGFYAAVLSRQLRSAPGDG